jgi:putative exporter of polyketide antibiotics
VPGQALTASTASITRTATIGWLAVLVNVALVAALGGVAVVLRARDGVRRPEPA